MPHSNPEAFNWSGVADPLAAYYSHAPARADSEHDPGEPPLDSEALWPRGVAEWFALSLTLLPALLLVPNSQAYRLPLRVGAYGISLVAFGLWWFNGQRRRDAKHPAEPWLLWVTVVLVLSLTHPLTSSLTAGLGQLFLYVAIFCPVFWARGYVATRRQLVRIVLLLLVCNGVNALVGVLQVYNPDRWMPQLSALYSTNRDMLSAASYVGPNGRLIVRPPGLFDSPGAVCGAGTIAALFGLVMTLETMAWWKRLVALGMAVAGVSAIYLSHVRISLIVLVGMMVMYVGMLILQRQTARVTAFGTLAAGMLVGGLTLATVLGGQSVADRFSTLFAEDPRTLYYSSRGISVEYAFTTLISDYPLGAGLARWGMMRYYFGDPAKLDSTELFAEVQPNAWILDGGVFLLFFYGAALVATAIYDLRLVQSLASRDDRLWSAAVVAANFGTLVLVFSFVPFGTAAGMQFWFLEGALHGAMAHRPRIR